MCSNENPATSKGKLNENQDIEATSSSLEVTDNNSSSPGTSSEIATSSNDRRTEPLEFVEAAQQQDGDDTEMEEVVEDDVARNNVLEDPEDGLQEDYFDLYGRWVAEQLRWLPEPDREFFMNLVLAIPDGHVQAG